MRARNFEYEIRERLAKESRTRIGFFDIRPSVAQRVTTSNRLYVVLGNDNATALIAAGFAAIGIDSIDGWIDEDTGEIAGDFGRIPWMARDVEIVVDPDTWRDLGAQRMVYALGREIQSRTKQAVRFTVFVWRDEQAVTAARFLREHGRERFLELQSQLIDHRKIEKLEDPETKVWFRKWWAELEGKRMQTKIENDDQERRKRAKAEAEAMEENQRTEALALLERADLLDEFVLETGSLGCAGEETNKKTLYLTYTSRLLPKPISLTVKGESSGGKNKIASTVGKFIPPEDVHFISAATPKAFFFLPGDLNHKVVVIAETPGAKDADYSIRTFESEQELVLLIPEKDKVTGTIVTRERKVKGPVSFIQTTTRPHLHPENETRYFDIFVDESEEQTTEIFKLDNSRYLGGYDPAKEETMLTKWRNAQRLLEPLPVIIPFVEHINFPTRPLRVRRDRPRFLALIEASALLHQHQRQRKVIAEREYIVASLDDYKTACDLGRELLKRIVTGATPKCKRVVEVAMELDAAVPGATFGWLDINKTLTWDRKTALKYIKEAVTLGCLEEESQGKGKKTLYTFIRSIDEAENTLLSKEAIEEKMGNLSNPSNARETANGQVNPVDSKENDMGGEVVHG